MMKKLVNEETFLKALIDTKKDLARALDKHNKITVHWINGDQDSGGKLFDKSKYYDTQKILYPGKVENYTLRVDNKSINKQQTLREFNGRKLEIHKVLKLIEDPNVRAINIYGDEGVGKTVLLKEICKYLGVRRIFDGTIYYHNFEKAKQMKDCRDYLLKKNKICHHNLEKILYIFDDIDDIEKNDDEF